MTRPLAPLSRHLLTRSDLARLGIQAGRILTWLAKGWLDQVGNLPGDDEIGDPVFAVTTRELRDELAAQLLGIGKDTVVFSPLRVRSLLLRAMLPVHGEERAAGSAPLPVIEPDAPAPAAASTQDPITEALHDPAVTSALQLAAEDLEAEVSKVLELAREEVHQEALERAAEAAAPREFAELQATEPAEEPEAEWSAEDGGEDADEGDFFDSADLAEELGIWSPPAKAAPAPAEASPELPAEPVDEPVAADDEVAAAVPAAQAEAQIEVHADDEARSEAETMVTREAEPIGDELEPVPDPEPAAGSEVPPQQALEPADSLVADQHAEVTSTPPPDPVPEEPGIAAPNEAPAAADAGELAPTVVPEVDAEATLPPPTEEQPAPVPVPNVEQPDAPTMSIQPATHEDVIPEAPGTEAPSTAAHETTAVVGNPAPTSRTSPANSQETAFDALLADVPTSAAPATELASAADDTPFVETAVALETTPEAEPTLPEATATMPSEVPIESPTEAAIDAAIDAGAAATAAASPSPAAVAAPHQELTHAAPESGQVAAVAMQRVESFLGELRHVLVELANRPQPQPAAIDVQPLVAAVQQGFVHAGEQARSTDSALASLTTRLGEFGEKVEHGVALAVHAALGPRAQMAEAAPAMVAAPSYVVARTERSTLALFAIGFLLLCWTAIFWFKTGNTRVAVATLVGANVVGCCLLVGRNRSS